MNKLEIMKKAALKSLNYIESLQFQDDKSKTFSLNAMEYWYPRIKNIPTPKTISIPIIFSEILSETESTNKPYTKTIVDLLIKYLDKFPSKTCFLRLSQTSAKFSGKNYVTATNIEDSLITIIMESCMGNLPSSQFVFLREIVDTNVIETLPSGLKINMEYRFFISLKNNKPTIKKYFNYWLPNQNISNTTRTTLDDFDKNFNKTIIENLISNAEYQNIDGDWSLDFLLDKEGNWILIDCALEKDSFTI